MRSKSHACDNDKTDANQCGSFLVEIPLRGAKFYQ